ncbi:FBD-associated F-box protein At5g44490-like [Pistacia vera]|uniref:FBD-associated F-box protein At5g44490-like n=1 Tax=Pistacia vera TaxID=55513 RepID=UPI001262BB29|nr:FBD-associated F-box protein At5g44490-like [Pistacia vera]
MDTFISLPNSKIKKLLKDQHASGGVDIISKLSDNILLYILSFLPISDVLRTSALSKRWKYLWASIFDIDVDETSYTLVSGTETSFLESVERLLIRRDSSHIRKFHLIEFDPESEWSSILPQCIKFCLKTIRILHLKGSDAELIWLKYFLGNTNVLERVTILCSESLQADSEKQKKINNEVQAIRKGLVSCVVEFL